MGITCLLTSNLRLDDRLPVLPFHVGGAPRLGLSASFSLPLTHLGRVSLRKRARPAPCAHTEKPHQPGRARWGFGLYGINLR
ncbi:hypothetical protein CCANI_08945 [Corynebacterium canis]|nr:hypothetical protein CCANI_08945 [Corynebacterium canis]